MKHSSETQQCIIYLPANSYPWLFPSTFRKLWRRPWCKRRHYGSVNPIPVVRLSFSWKAALTLEAEWQCQVHRLRENMGTFPVNIKPAYVLQGFFQIFLVFSIALLKEILWAREGGFAWQNHHPSLILPRRSLLSVCHLIKRVRHAVLTSPCSMQTTSLMCQ